MDPGKLNCLVVIHQPPSTQDALGQPTGSWTVLATVWANIRYLNGVETIKADATTTVTKVSIRIRRRADVTAAMRVTYNGVTFHINNVLPDELDRQRVDLVCEVIQ